MVSPLDNRPSEAGSAIGGQNQISRATLAAIVESAGDAILSRDLDGVVTSWNRGAEKIYGYTAAEAVGSSASFLIPPGQEEDLHELLDRISRGEHFERYETERVTKDGGHIHVSMSASPIRDDAGKVTGASMIVHEITADVETKAELADQERKLKEAQRLAHVGHWELDLATNTLSWSDEVYRIFGLEPHKFGATYEAFLEHVHPDDRDYVNQAYTESVKNRTGYDIEHRVLRQDGSVRVVNERCDTHYDENGNPLRSTGTVLDITELRQASEKLRQAGAYNRSLIESSLDPLVTIDSDGRITDVNRATEKVTGRRREELIGTDFCDYFTEPDAARSGYQQVFREGFVHDFPLSIRGANGRITPVLYNASVYRDESGEVVGVFAAARDVTVIHKATEEIRRLSQQNELILNSAGEGIYGADTEGRITFVNPAAARMLGYRVEELLGRDSHSTFHHTRVDGSPYPADECPLHASLLRGDVSENKDEIFWLKDGSYINVEYVNTPMIRDGRIVGAVVTFRDVRERLKAQEQLRRAGAYNRSLIEASLDPLVTIDSAGKITDANAATESITGLGRADLIGTDFTDYFTEPAKARAGYEHVFREGFVHDYQLEIRRTDGHVTPVLYNASVFRDESGEVMGVFAAARDMTSRLQSEAELRRTNRALQVLSECNQVLVRARDEAQLLSRACCTLIDVGEYPLAWIGFPEEEGGRRRIQPVIAAGAAGNGLKLAREAWAESPQAQGVAVRAIEEKAPVLVSCVREDGTVEPWSPEAPGLGCHSSLALPLMVDDDVLGVLHVCAEEANAFAQSEVNLLLELANDIAYGVKSIRTREQHDVAEKALRESEAKYHNLFEESKEMIFVASPSGRIIDLNQAGVELLGYESREAMPEIDLLRDIFTDAGERARFRQELSFEGYVSEQEIKVRRSDGQELDVLVSVSTIRDERGEVAFYSGVLHDMSENRRMQEQLYRAQRLESVGRLAGGIAHDFNNFLTAVKGYIDLALNELPQPGLAGEDLLEASKSADRAAGLVRQLLIFSRRESMSLKPMNLNVVVQELLKMLTTLIGERYRIAVDLDESLPRVSGDAGHIEQVIMNLVVNSRDAMPTGGTIEIHTRSVEVSDERAQVHEAPGGRYAVLSVRDTGIGMDEETLSHIFEPFFTKKPGKEGTGLGLSLVYGITRQHGGWVEVESQLGAGSTFHIFFPAITAVNKKEQAPTARPGDLAGHGERILVVEDEEPVRNLLVRILQGSGYEVEAAPTAELALERFQQEDGGFDLVCSDVVLPGEDGLWLAERICEEKPGMPILLASGYNQPAEERAIRKHGFRFISKPYAREDVLASLKEMLCGNGSE